MSGRCWWPSFLLKLCRRCLACSATRQNLNCSCQSWCGCNGRKCLNAPLRRLLRHLRRLLRHLHRSLHHPRAHLLKRCVDFLHTTCLWCTAQTLWLGVLHASVVKENCAKMAGILRNAKWQENVSVSRMKNKRCWMCGQVLSQIRQKLVNQWGNLIHPFAWKCWIRVRARKFVKVLVCVCKYWMMFQMMQSPWLIMWMCDSLQKIFFRLFRLG